MTANQKVIEGRRALAYSMDALVPGFFLWLGSLSIRIGGSEAEENHLGVIHPFTGIALVLPNYQLWTTYQGIFE